MSGHKTGGNIFAVNYLGTFYLKRAVDETLMKPWH